MNAAPFYELRKRLYNSAAAGCSNIKEDFRLKKALEEFQPLSQANKTFGRLGQMTEKLFAEEDPAPLIADCIALADALAVAQGICTDSSETEKSDIHGTFQQRSVPYSRINALCENVRKASPKLEELTPDEIKMLTDPRVAASFAAVSNTNNMYLYRFFEQMVKMNGKALVPVLKKKINISDENESGARIRYISLAAGADENDLYVSIAENENASPKLRTAAIEAMADIPENKEKLLGLYRTEKGKIKNAALLALAGFDCPECEEIFAKLTAKYKNSYDPYIAASGGKICTEFAIKHIKEELTGNAGDPKKIRNYTEYCELLANKPYADEGFMLITECGIQYIMPVSAVLIRNLRNDLRLNEFEELIHRLYKAKKDVYFLPEFFLRLMKTPDSVFEEMRDEIQPAQAADLIGNVRYDIGEDGYCYTDNNRTSRIFMFKELPDSVLDFLCTKTTDNRMNYLRAKAFMTLLRKCRDSDFERIRKSACRFAEDISHTSPIWESVTILDEYGDRDNYEKYRGMITDYVMYSYKCGNTYGYVYVGKVIEKFPLPMEVRIKELEVLLERLQKAEVFGTDRNYEKSRTISVIESYISKNKI